MKKLLQVSKCVQGYVYTLFIVALSMVFMFGHKSAEAALNLTGVTVDTDPVFDLALIIITAIAGIWAIKKVIKLGNRS